MLASLEITNFRNLKNSKLEFAKTLNIFYGDNAQGKTNLLEAIFLISTGKSFKSEVDRELIAWGQTSARVVAQAPPLEIELTINETNKRLLVNRQSRRLIELVGEFLVVLFAPEDLSLVYGAPSQRRAWINSLISRVDRKYLFNLGKFNQVIKNRNRVLLSLNQGGSPDLGVWDEQFIKLSVDLWVSRQEYLAKVNSFLKQIAPKLGVSKITVEYHPQLAVKDAKSLKAVLTKELEKRRREEVARAQTVLGPHRDDFKLIFEQIESEKVLTKDVSVFGSRGEQRTGVLSLKLAEIELIEMIKGKRPTLLLDDVLSEFDKKHREMIQGLLYRQQSFITTTATDLLDKKLLSKAKLFQLKTGQVEAG
ncbi:MAG: DNA replication/repair protein RecF [bacterium]|nr:DNA replication/repair protein RecF [bacterium]